MDSLTIKNCKLVYRQKTELLNRLIYILNKFSIGLINTIQSESVLVRLKDPQ